MKTYLLDKVISVNTTYRAETDKAYVIKAIGTDSSSKATLYVDETPVLETLTTLAPLFKTSSNLLGPFKLGNLFIVVPPTKTFRFTGASGSKMRIIGDIVELAPGETLTPDLMSRYSAQGREYYTYLSFSYSHGTDTAWSAGDENVIGYGGTSGAAFTGPVAEKWTLNNFIGVDIDNVSGGLTYGQFGLRFYINDRPLDIVDTNMGPIGIDVYSMPLPPADTTNEVPFMLTEKPFEIEPGMDFKITLTNVSGSDISPTSGASIDVTVYAIAIRKLL